MKFSLFFLSFLLLACTANTGLATKISASPSAQASNPAPQNSSSPSAPSSTPLPQGSSLPISQNSPISESSWLGTWTGGNYKCTIGETFTDDTIVITRSDKAGEVKLSLYDQTILPVKVIGNLKAPDKIEIPEQEFNGGPASGTLTFQAGTLTLDVSTLGGAITCKGINYRKK